jgi:hypothetical protein
MRGMRIRLNFGGIAGYYIRKIENVRYTNYINVRDLTKVKESWLNIS